MTAADIPPPDNPPDGDAPKGPALNERAPSVQALRILQQLVIEARREVQFRNYAEVDLRAMNADLQVALAKDPKDSSAVQWLRQLALSWNTKLRGNPALRFRRMLDLIEEAQRGGRR
jgi:hypothetical protein